MAKLDVPRLDKHIERIRGESDRLRALKMRWAESRAAQWDELLEDLQDLRRDMQMTGMHGKRIDG